MTLIFRISAFMILVKDSFKLMYIDQVSILVILASPDCVQLLMIRSQGVVPLVVFYISFYLCICFIFFYICKLTVNKVIFFLYVPKP